MKNKIKKLKYAGFITKSFTYYLWDIFGKTFIDLKTLFKRDKIKFIFVVSLSVFLLTLMFFVITNISLTGGNTIKTSPVPTSSAQTENNKDSTDRVPRGDNTTETTDAVTGFLDNFDGAVKLIKPVLDNFVSNTADVTSRDNASGRVKFQDDTSIASIQSFYEISFKIAVSFLGILIVCIGINYAVRPDEVKIKDTIIKICTTALLLALGLIIMSYSIQFINEINKAFMQDKSITDYMLSFTQKVRSDLPTADHGLGQNLKDIFPWVQIGQLDLSLQYQ